MNQPHDIFEGETPIAIIRRWMEEARETEPNDHNAMALATCGNDGMPNVRTVLLKEIEDDGFVFYTNYGSAKSAELEQNSKAAFVVHWKSLRRQIRVRGIVSREDGAQADAYFDSRHPESRIGAWVSRQSQPLASREVLLEKSKSIVAEIGPTPKRPPFWGGFRIKPMEIELWADGAFRLHDRFKWNRDNTSGAWVSQRLYP